LANPNFTNFLVILVGILPQSRAARLLSVLLLGGLSGAFVPEVRVRAGTTAEIASIPDPNLRAGLEAALGKSAGEPIFRSELASLTSLRIRNRTIGDLAGLEHATSLTDLNLGFTGVGTADNLSSLSALTRLTRLNLNTTGMSNLSPLSTLTALQRLELVDNGITDVSGIKDLSSLNALFLRNNNITNIEPLVSGSALGRDDRVDLQANPLTVGAYSTHIPTLQGRGVTVSFNPFSICDRTGAVETAILTAILAQTSANVACDEVTIDQLADIQILFVGNKSLAALQAGDFDGLTSLNTLQLQRNSLESLPTGVFDGLTSLDTLQLQFNSLKSLPTGVFDGLTSLGHLFLSRNQLGSLPADVFDDLTNLEELDLSINPLVSLPAFGELSALRTLNLDETMLTSLPADVFKGLTSLRTLDLTGNSLESLQAGAFNGLSALQTLTLDQTMLTSLPENLFLGLGMLTSLDLSSNSIATLDSDAFAGLTMNEVTIQLEDNQLMSLPAGVFAGLQNATFQFVTSTESNPGVPFPLTLELARTDNTDAEAAGSAEVKVRLAQGAPFDMTVELSARDGTLSATSATIDQGETESQAITVTGTPDVIATVMLGDPPGIDDDYDTNPATFLTSVGAPLSLFMGNTRPTAEAGDNQIVDEGATVTLSGSGTDPDNDALTYRWMQTGGTPTVMLTNANTATATFTAPSALSTAAILTFQLTVTDVGTGELTATDEVMITVRSTPRVIVTQPAGGISVDEDGGTGTYSVRLSTPPTGGDVTVTPTIALPTGVTTAPISLTLPEIGGMAQTALTFTTSNWNMDQTVEVIGVPDDIDNAGDQRTATITHDVAGGGYADVNADDVAVTAIDDDTAGVTIFEGVNFSGDNMIEVASVILNEVEDDNREGYVLDVRLDSEPTGNDRAANAFHA